MFIQKIVPIIVLAAAVVVIVLLGTEVWNPVWNPFKEMPSGVVEQAIDKLWQAETLAFEGSFQADIQVKVKEDLETADEALQEQIAMWQGFVENAVVALDFSGLVDKTNKENVKVQTDVDVALSSQGMAFSLGGQIKSIGEDLYMQINTLPSMPFLTEGLDEIKGQWFKIEKTDLEGTSGQAFDKETKERFFNDLKALVQGKGFFTIEKNLGGETIDGRATDHYLVELDKETLKEVIPEFFNIIKTYLSAEEQAEYEQNLEKVLTDFPQKLDAAWQEIGGVELEVWLTKELMLKKAKWQRAIDLSSFEEIEAAIEGGGIVLDLEMQFSQIGEEMDIEAPEDAKPFDELFSTALPTE